MNAPAYSPGQRLASEFIGAAFLLAAVVGSGLALLAPGGGEAAH